ncbi:hypothetical protein O3P69_011194 [Scylla paramamosain]|uniref:Uncharacterized protein n=1 Tax=Scylla paramamosain TaxID=85552 RepID=A0AAW0STB8_SCYPA
MTVAWRGGQDKHETNMHRAQHFGTTQRLFNPVTLAQVTVRRPQGCDKDEEEKETDNIRCRDVLRQAGGNGGEAGAVICTGEEDRE